MARFNCLWLVFIVHLCLWVFKQVDCRVINIYSSTEPESVLANLSRTGWTNYTFEASTIDIQTTFQLLSIDSTNGLVRMISRPDCRFLQLNPFTVYIESSSIYNSSERALRPLTVSVFGENCIRKLQQSLPRTAPIGTRVLRLMDIVLHTRKPLVNPASLKLRKPWRKYFRIGAKSDYLVLRRSLREIQERVLVVELVFPESAKHGRYKQPLVARLELFIDNHANRFDKNTRRFRRRIQQTAPRFSSPYLTAHIREDASVGTSVGTIRAEDTNNGNAGKIRYSMEASQNLLSQSFFQIDADSGLIKTTASLDRENMPMHYFRVKAEYEQHKSLYAEADLTIIVDDVNDNAPKFEASSYSKSVPEDIYVGDTVLDVRARDLDTGSNAEIRYSITNNGGVNSVFRIGQSSGSITVDRALDRESVQEYSLTIQASDGGSPPKTDTATVRITVTDVNDCVPQFSKREYTETIPEDTKPGQLVLKVSATDKDLGSNAVIVYSFSSGNDQGLFSINRINGQIKVSKELNYEYSPVYTLFVMAQDKGEYPNFNETSVEIYLEDVNDNAPQFVNSDFQELVSERENVGHTFTRVQAFDDDDGTNKQIVYSLVESNLPFGITSDNGDLYLTKKLDREVVNRYIFHVKAEDKGKPPLSNRARVTVNVGDINDNPPKFSKPVYYGSVEENARFGTTILRVTATDPDLGQSNIMYTFDQNSRCFRISGNTGVITLSCRLDYGKTKFYSLTVKARDNQLESSAFVRINVTDSNTHTPIFQQRIYRQRISEATAVGGRVLVVKATDNDQGLNAKLTYAIKQSQQDFKINPKTGEITVAQTLDRETSAQYRFEVIATDQGTPQLTGTANVHITVTDVNDNKPRFLQSNYGKAIFENVSPGTRVLQVSAVDDDEGSNKAIIYSFATNGNFILTFTLIFCMIKSILNIGIVKGKVCIPVRSIRPSITKYAHTNRVCIQKHKCSSGMWCTLPIEEHCSYNNLISNKCK